MDELSSQMKYCVASYLHLRATASNMPPLYNAWTYKQVNAVWLLGHFCYLKSIHRFTEPCTCKRSSRLIVSRYHRQRKTNSRQRKGERGSYKERRSKSNRARGVRASEQDREKARAWRRERGGVRGRERARERSSEKERERDKHTHIYSCARKRT